MKNIAVIVFLFLITFNAFSQSTFDKSLNEVSANIADKLIQKNKKKIVVLYITDVNKVQTVAGKYIADVISVNIVNNIGNFEVFDRENLSGIAEAKKLIAEGYVDASNAKELGKLLAVETIIIGNYTVLSSTMKLTLKALDVNNGFVIAASMKDLPINADAGALLGINLPNNSSPDGGNRGFNNPVKSGENYNNPETVNKDCEKNNTGDYCFENQYNKQVKIYIFAEGQRGTDLYLTLSIGQTQCFYNLKAGNYTYRVTIGDIGYYRYDIAQGQFLVDKCKSKTFFIK